MVDVHTPSIRSKNMRAIRGKNTKPEILLRKALHALGFRFRLHVRALPGSPDIVLPKYRAVIFVHGCFWHGHSCPMFRLPQTRTEFWLDKISENVRRDEAAVVGLVSAGWRVATLWECAQKGRGRIPAETVLRELTNWLAFSDAPVIEIAGSVNVES